MKAARSCVVLDVKCLSLYDVRNDRCFFGLKRLAVDVSRIGIV